jgi:hypothetical protein
MIESLLANRYAVALTDYEGLGESGSLDDRKYGRFIAGVGRSAAGSTTRGNPRRRPTLFNA